MVAPQDAENQYSMPPDANLLASQFEFQCAEFDVHTVLFLVILTCVDFINNFVVIKLERVL